MSPPAAAQLPAHPPDACCGRVSCVCAAAAFRAGTGVVVASLYYQSASKSKDGKDSHKEAARPSSVVHASSTTMSTGDSRTSFGGVGQAPRTALQGADDPADSEAAGLLVPRG